MQHIADASDVDQAIDELIRGAGLDGALTLALRYSLGLDSEDARFRGKRVRSALCLGLMEALGGDRARAMPAAVACEVLHSFLLVHDDIADGDRMRRGRESVWAKFGVAVGVNVGDVLAALTTRALLRASWDDATTLRILRALDRTLIATGEGQALDLAARGLRLTRAEVEQIALKKTAFYLSLPLESAVILAGASPEVIDALHAFATAVGPMFQLSDDLIDLSDEKGRDLRGNDVREGKCTALVVVACERATEPDRARLLEILATPRERTRVEDVDWVVSLFERLDVRDEVVSMMRALLDRAIAALDPVPEPAREWLAQVARLLAARDR